MRARFIGDPNDDGEGPKVLRLFGIEFLKGAWVSIDDNELAARKLQGNSHFEVDGGAAPVSAAAPAPLKRGPGRPPKTTQVLDEASDDEFTDL